jgi:hypothetical protein
LIMGNYVKSTNFAAKDNLPKGDPLKVVKGTELDVEFNAIATSIVSKANNVSPSFTGTPFAPTASPGTATNQIATTAFVDVAVTNERTATATLTNKTLTSPAISSPSLTGSPTAPTAAAGTNNTQVATTAFVGTAVTNERSATATLTNKTLSNAVLTGNPTAPTASAGDNDTSVATTAFVQTAVRALYPVGSIYINATNSTNPGTLLGFGTWVAFGAGRVPVGFNSADTSFNAAEKTGGSKNAIVVSHTHSVTGTAASQTLTGSYDTGFRLPGTNADASGIVSVTEGSAVTSWGASGSGTRKIINVNATHSHSVTGTAAATGSSGTDANLQPYITVYMWKRTA